MQLGARGAGDLGQAAFDRQMDVLVGQIEAKTAGFDLAFDLLESLDDPIRFGVADQSRLGDHAGVRDRAADIVPEQAAVER